VQVPPSVPPGPGRWPAWTRPGLLRASDEDREHTVTELTEHHVEGRLSAEELSERTRLAFSATTNGQLNDLLADLPARSRGSVTIWDSLLTLRRRGPFPGVSYLGFWPRAGALWADLILLGGVGYAVPAVTHDSYLAAPVTVVQIGYFVVLWATTGKTLGLWLVGGRVVREEDGGRLSLGRSLVRLVGYAVGLASCFLGFAWAGIDRRKQAWHDKMAGSLVVRRLR
jgi:uncharacterized RDD family membrane protein YckC